SPVKHVSFSPAGDLLAVGRQDYKGEVWQVTAGQKLELFSSYNRLENAVGGDGKGYVLATSESVVWLHDTDGEAFGLNLQGQTGKILDLAISTDGRLLAAGSTDKKLYLWRVFDVTVQEENGIANTSTRTLLGPLLLTLDQHDGWVTSVAFCPEDDTMASASEDGTVKVWRVS
ncbi:MAG: hypothetical protein GY792_36640, partial [Gammaproteobacteria bacterium]|nr:hypothetical protein [Gammaproteobacteria bacterium]